MTSNTTFPTSRSATLDLATPLMHFFFWTSHHVLTDEQRWPANNIISVPFLPGQRAHVFSSNCKQRCRCGAPFLLWSNREVRLLWPVAVSLAAAWMHLSPPSIMHRIGLSPRPLCSCSVVHSTQHRVAAGARQLWSFEPLWPWWLLALCCVGAHTIFSPP
jgi:hypothetical protein